MVGTGEEGEERGGHGEEKKRGGKQLREGRGSGGAGGAILLQ